MFDAGAAQGYPSAFLHGHHEAAPAPKRDGGSSVATAPAHRTAASSDDRVGGSGGGDDSSRIQTRPFRPLPSPPLPPLFRGAIMARWRPASPSPSTTRRRERDSTHARLRLLLPLPSSRHQWEKRGAHKNGGVGGIGPGPRPAGACSHRSSSSIRLQQSVRDGHGEGELHLRLPTQQSLFKETNPNDERGAGLQMHTVCTSLEYSTPTRLHAHAQLGMSSGVSVPGCARAWGSDLPTDPEFKVP